MSQTVPQDPRGDDLECGRYEYIGSIESIIANKVASYGIMGMLTTKLKALFSKPDDDACSFDPNRNHATLLFIAAT